MAAPHRLSASHAAGGRSRTCRQAESDPKKAAYNNKGHCYRKMPDSYEKATPYKCNDGTSFDKNPEACLGSGNETEEWGLCAENHVGPLCDVCGPNSFKGVGGGGLCSQCPEGGISPWSVFLPMLLVLGGLGFLGFKKFKKMEKAKKDKKEQAEKKAERKAARR